MDPSSAPQVGGDPLLVVPMLPEVDRRSVVRLGEAPPKGLIPDPAIPRSDPEGPVPPLQGVVMAVVVQIKPEAGPVPSALR